VAGQPEPAAVAPNAWRRMEAGWQPYMAPAPVAGGPASPRLSAACSPMAVHARLSCGNAPDCRPASAARAAPSPVSFTVLAVVIGPSALHPGGALTSHGRKAKRLRIGNRLWETWERIRLCRLCTKSFFLLWITW
jgi:hypothetical protein